MEIRHCDKCKGNIDIEHLKDADRWLRDVQALKINMPIPVTTEEKQETHPPHGGLDDRDIFTNNLVIKQIDLCENCVIEFASIIKLWVNNVRVSI